MRDGASARPLILHVVESLGAGVNTAVEDYMRSTPGFRHRLLGSPRAELHSAASLEALTEGIDTMGSGTFRRIGDVRRAAREHAPDIVHAHSSFAGAYARLAGLAPRRVVYTPHCFPFERRDVSGPVRAAFWLMEAILSVRGRTIVAVSDREAGLARRLPGRNLVVVVPNVARLDPDPPEPPVRADLVVALGRLSAQKGPGFFAEAARASRERGDGLTWRWVGGGEANDEAEVRAAGAEVTGWVERSEAIRQLREAAVYVHTAAWEGFPITLLEAATLGKPLVARRIPALEESGLALVDDPVSMAGAVARAVSAEGKDEALRGARGLLERHRPDEQARLLTETYERVIADQSRSR